MKRVCILSASDRNNYGDLLFPIIASKELTGLASIYNVSTTKSDLSNFGALPTLPYSSLFANKDPRQPKNILLIAGGEVIDARWSMLFSYIYPCIHNLFRLLPFKRTIKLIAECIIRHSVGGGQALPFVPSSRQIVTNYHLIFHAIGGSDAHQSEYRAIISDTLASAAYISLRDILSYNSIKKNLGCKKAILTPDSAILVSQYYPLGRRIINEPYICFQIRDYYSHDALSSIAFQLKNLATHTQKLIVLIPIGSCSGHDDIKPLQIILSILSDHSKLILPTSITDIVNVIGHSDLYIGTSLHGIITAMSYCRPYLAIDGTIQKNLGYLKTWAPAAMARPVEFSAIFEQAIHAIQIPKLSLQRSRDRQVAQARNSFEKIREIIKSGH